jgi:hypothetical protein
VLHSTVKPPFFGNADAFALLEMLCDAANEIAEDGFTCSFCQLMLLGQGARCLSVTGRSWSPQAFSLYWLNAP